MMVSMMVTGKSANPIRMAWGNSMGIPALARRGVMLGTWKKQMGIQIRPLPVVDPLESEAALDAEVAAGDVDIGG